MLRATYFKLRFNLFELFFFYSLSLFCGFHLFPLGISLLAIPLYVFFLERKRGDFKENLSIFFFKILVSFLVFGLGLLYVSFKKEIFYKTPEEIKKEDLIFKIEKLKPFHRKVKVYVRFLEGIEGEGYFLTKGRTYFPGEFCYVKQAILKRRLSKIPIYPVYFKESSLYFLDLKEVPLCVKKILDFSFGNFYENVRWYLFQVSERFPFLAKAIFRANILGFKGDFPFKYKKLLKEGGLYHLLAISGFHLAVIYVIFYFIGRITGSVVSLIWEINIPLQFFGYFFGLLGAFFILVLSDFYPSALRAFIFLFIYTFSRFLFKEVGLFEILCLTAFICLLVKPDYILNLSFVLSFLAILGIIWGLKVFRKISLLIEDTLRDHKILTLIGTYFFETFLCSFFIFILLFPFLLYINGEVSFSGPLNNLVGGLFWGFVIIPLSVVLLFMVFLSPQWAEKFSYLLQKCGELFFGFPFLKWTFSPGLPVNLFILWFLFSILTFFLLRKFVKKGFPFWGLLIVILILFYLGIDGLYKRSLFMVYVNVPSVVGKLMIIKYKNNHNFLRIYERGYHAPGFVKKFGIKRLDLIILPLRNYHKILKGFSREFFIKGVSFKRKEKINGFEFWRFDKFDVYEFREGLTVIYLKKEEKKGLREAERLSPELIIDKNTKSFLLFPMKRKFLLCPLQDYPQNLLDFLLFPLNLKYGFSKRCEIGGYGKNF